MDEYRVAIESTAKSDLRGILRYITEILKEPMVARRLYFLIKEKVMNLDKMPQRHPLVRDETLAARGLHWMPAENYSVFYVIDEENRKVNILRILHGRRDWQNLL